MKTEPEVAKTEETPERGSDAPEGRAGGTRLQFLETGKLKPSQWLRRSVAYGELRHARYGLRPVIILVLISVFASFDRVSFTYLAPAILRDLNIEVTTIVNIVLFVEFLLVFTLIGVAYYADRYPRVPLVGIGSIVAGALAFMTGRAGGAGSLGSFRVGSTVGRTISTVPLFSIIADSYPPEQRGKAFALVGVMFRGATLFAPLAITYWAVQTSWRVPFSAIGIGLVAGGVLALLFLREPVRGYMERKALGATEDVAEEEVEPPSLGEAWRVTWSIRTLRRIFISNIFDNTQDIVVISFFVLYMFDQYGLSLIDLGLLGAFLGIFGIAGGLLGGGLVDVLMRRRPQRVLTLVGMFSALGGLAWIGIVTAPPLWVVVTFLAVFGFFNSLLDPASSTIYAQIAPAHVRNLALAVQRLSAVPAVLVAASVNAFLFTNYGFRGALAAVIPFGIVSAFIYMSAAGLFERDMRAAFAANMAAEEFRRAKREGRGKLLVSRDVQVEYDGVQVLFGVDFDVEEGEIVAILGTNGAGKSTLLRAISGIREASGGAIVFDGRDITHMPPNEIALRQVIHMPGGRGIFPDLTVQENILLGTWMLKAGEEKERLAEVYRIFPKLKERAGIKAAALSGGEQQMVSLAQAFLSKPRLLMIDELSLGLAPAVVEELIEIVKAINESGVTVIVVEQSVNVALTLAQRAIFMEKGEVRFFGETQELLNRPDILRAVYVKGTGALTEAPASGLKSARELRRYDIERAHTVLDVKGITKTYGGVVAVDDVSFALREGEILGLMGPNGAGKTTVFEIISGFQAPDAGTVIFDGVDITNLSPDARANRKLIRRFQDARLFPSLTVYENILLALDQRLAIRNIFMNSLPIPQIRQAERRVRLRADQLLALLELGGYQDKFVKELSTGLRRITDLACVLAAEPRVLLLDEPSTGIAQAEAEGLAPLLRRVRLETGCSMLVIEHDMPLISAISDELIAMDQGRVLMRGDPEEVLNDERVIQSYLGTTEEVVKRSGLVA